MNFRQNISGFTVAVIAVISLLANFTYLPGNILSWDIFGYYLYLPMTFIYNDLGMENFPVVQNIIDEYQNTATFYQAMELPSGKWVMKYSMGLAILYLPFFIIGHLIALLSGFPADGFSAPYQYSLLVGGMFYTLAGIYLLRKLLLKFFNDKVTSITLLVLFFGTNYFFHTSFHGQNSMSHNFLFTLYVIIILLTIKWHESHRLKHLIWLGIVCGITILSRPSEVVCLFIPLLWGITGKASLTDKLKFLLRYRLQIIFFSGVLLLIGSFQFIYWKIYTGKFLYYSYGGNPSEGFEFFRPYTLEVLFSFRKGWLIYTPIMLFALAGFYFLYRKKRELFYPTLLFFLFNLYFVSSWSCWWYAESFSQRSLIQSYAVMALPLGFSIDFLNSKKSLLSKGLFSLMALLVGLNLFQTWQFEKGIIHGSRMTKDYYFAVFGKTSVSDADRKLLLINRAFDGTEVFDNEEEHHQKIFKELNFRDREDSGLVLDHENQKSPVIEGTYEDLTSEYYAWIRVKTSVFTPSGLPNIDGQIVFFFEHNGYPYKQKILKFSDLDLQINQWNEISFDYLTPEVRTVKDRFKLFIENQGKEKIYVGELKMEVFEPK